MIAVVHSEWKAFAAMMIAVVHSEWKAFATMTGSIFMISQQELKMTLL